jgi:hypothetical protein
MTTTRNLPPGANGVLRLDLGPWGLWQKIEVVGGPYRRRPGDHYGVCLLESEPASYGVWLPIPDFSIPESREDVEYALKEVLHQCMLERRVWIGCAGGLGRTGLVLALLAKVAGYSHPVRHVRDSYHPHAVETDQQMDYVAEFEVGPIRRWMLKRSFRRLIGRPRAWLHDWFWTVGTKAR